MYYNKDNKKAVYIVLMHSGTPLANIIKKVTNDEFSHACISFICQPSAKFLSSSEKSPDIIYISFSFNFSSIIIRKYCANLKIKKLYADTAFGGKYDFSVYWWSDQG